MKRVNSLLAAMLLLGAGGALADGNLADVVANGEREQALRMLDEAGTDVNALQSDGSSALLYAIHQGDAELVGALIEAGAEVNHRNAYGATTMGEAAMAGSVEILRLLLDKGADVDMANPEGETALMIAARSGNLETAGLLLEHGADVNAREQWGGQTAAMWAAAQSHPAMLALLAEHGADFDMHGFARLWERRIPSEPRPKDMNKGGFSPLLYAAREGCTECIGVLAGAGADLNAVDPDGVSPLNLALINLHFETAAALIEAGADVNQWDLFGRAPLYNAVDLHTLPEGGRPDIPSEDPLTGYDIAVMLLERGADPNMQLKLRPPYRNAVFDRGSDQILSNGATPLLRAARAADNDSVRLLLEHGALPDLPNAGGVTPLMAVAGIEYPAEPTRGRYKTEEASIETIGLLLEAGADINAITGDPAVPPWIKAKPGRGDGRTALHGASIKGWTRIAQFLVDSGAAQEVEDAAGTTPFDLAMGRYPAGFLQAPPEPMWDMARLLQEACMQDDNCTIDQPVDFDNPNAIQ